VGTGREQAAGYGRYTEPPSRARLDRFSFLDDADGELIAGFQITDRGDLAVGRVRARSLAGTLSRKAFRGGGPSEPAA
jgi:hypothetical protein